MRETFEDIVHDVTAVVPNVPTELARMWVTKAFRRIAERREWSWMYGFTNIYVPASYAVGLCSISQNSDTVTFSGGAAVTPEMIGRQINFGSSSTIHTITEYLSTTSLRIDPPWLNADRLDSSYTILLMYIVPPEDFFAWDSVVTSYPIRHRLRLDIERAVLDLYDPLRTRVAGYPRVLSFADYSRSYLGEVSPVVQALGSGASPASSGGYIGAKDALFTAEVTTTGITGVADFKWKKDGGAYVSGVLTTTDAYELQEGVYLSWPSGVSYTDGDVFVVSAKSTPSPGLPRYELYPHQTNEQVLPARYVKRMPDIEDVGSSIPRYIRGDVILEGALEEAASWPGSATEPNPYAQISRREYHRLRFKEMMEELARQDNEIYQQNLFDDIPFAKLPWETGMEGGWLYPDRAQLDWFTVP